MKDNLQLTIKGFILFFFFGLVLSSCCRNKHSHVVNITDPPFADKIDLEDFFGKEHKDELISISTEKRNNSEDYFILTVDNPYFDKVNVKFVQVAHHHLPCTDGQTFNAIGFLEIYSSKITNQKNIAFVKEEDNSKVKKYVINIPKKNIPNVMELMVYSAQSTPHNFQGSNGSNHSVGHRVRNPW